MKSTNLFDSRALCQTKKKFKSFPYWGLEFKEQDKISDVWKLVWLWLNYKQIVYTVIRQNSKAFQAFEENREAFEVYMPFSKYVLDSDFE